MSKFLDDIEEQCSLQWAFMEWFAPLSRWRNQLRTALKNTDPQFHHQVTMLFTLHRPYVEGKPAWPRGVAHPWKTVTYPIPVNGPHHLLDQARSFLCMRHGYKFDKYSRIPYTALIPVSSPERQNPDPDA